MKILEVICWLLYACLGFLFWVFYGLAILGSLAYRAQDVHGLFWIELAGLINIALFCSTLVWCADATNVRERLRFLKVTGFLLTVNVIVVATCCYLGKMPDSGDFIGVFALVMTPLCFSMASCAIRSKISSEEISGSNSAAVILYRRIYSGSIFVVLVLIWNLLLFRL